VDSELPFSLSSFIAERRGISEREAEELLAHWLETYESRSHSTHPAPAEADYERDASSLRICA
jgi:hypothetical protein